jgi:hypothetical protein
MQVLQGNSGVVVTGSNNRNSNERQGAFSEMPPFLKLYTLSLIMHIMLWRC